MRTGRIMLAALAMIALGMGMAPAQPANAILANDQLVIGFLFDAPADGKLAPGDRLELAFHFGMPEPGHPYPVQPGDEVHLFFPFSPEVNRPVIMIPAQSSVVPDEENYLSLSGRFIVQPEGTLVLKALSLPLLVIDRTTSEIATMVTEAYSLAGILQHPEVNVSVVPRMLREETIREMLRPRGGEGPARLEVTISRGGTLSAPLLPSVRATGLTAGQLGEELTRRYRSMRYPHLTVTAWRVAESDPNHDSLTRLLDRINPVRVKVSNSGSITLPLIAGHLARSKSIEQLSQELTERYHELGHERIGVTVWFEDSVSVR